MRISRAALRRNSFYPVAPPLDQRAALKLRNEFVPLIDAIVTKHHDAGILAVGVAFRKNLGIGVERVAVARPIPLAAPATKARFPSRLSPCGSDRVCLRSLTMLVTSRVPSLFSRCLGGKTIWCGR